VFLWETAYFHHSCTHFYVISVNKRKEGQDSTCSLEPQQLKPQTEKSLQAEKESDSNKTQIDIVCTASHLLSTDNVYVGNNANL